MPVEIVYQPRFDRTASQPDVSLIEFHSQFESDRGRLLWYLIEQKEVSVAQEIFCKSASSQEENGAISEKYVEWLRLHAKGTVKLVSHEQRAPIAVKWPRGVWCLTGSGKTSRLEDVKLKFPEASFREISAASLIRGELGETQKRLRSAFNEGEFPIILWDDIDLTLSTEGRIVKEILADLLRLLENFSGLFVMTSSSAESVPKEIASRVSKWS